MSGVAMSRWSMDLNPRVRGKGSLTVVEEEEMGRREGESELEVMEVRDGRERKKDELRMNPEKKKLIWERRGSRNYDQLDRTKKTKTREREKVERSRTHRLTQPIIKKFGTIITICFFIPSIIPSI